MWGGHNGWLTKNGFTPPAIGGGGGGGVSRAYLGNSGDIGSGTTFSLNIGTASADRFIVLAVIGNATPQTYAATVNGVSLTNNAYDDAATFGFPLSILSGLVTTGSGSQSIVVTSTQGDIVRVVHAWAVTGNASIAFKHSAGGIASGGPYPITIANGDLMFGVVRIGGASPATWNSSTRAADALHADNSYGGLSTADWVMGPGDAGTFHVGADTSNNYLAASFG